MSLFGFGKKEEKKEQACSCKCDCTAEDIAGMDINSCCGAAVNGICCIRVLGAGCKSCHELYENVKKAVREMGLSVEVEYITDMERVMSYGVMSMPAVVVNEKVVSMGRVLKPDEVKKLLGSESV
ncbi:MAG: thioredoxin family protein [Oscillospiraceae bacterium]